MQGYSTSSAAALVPAGDLAVPLALAVGSAVGLALCLRAMIRLHRAAPRPPNDAGVATVEFALVMPIVLFLILILTQTTLLMAAQFYVHYAASAATRVAVVQIPRNLADLGEPRNVITARPGSAKFDAIRRAAQFALVPVSGRDESGGVDEDAFIEAMRDHFAALDEPAPRWVDTLLGERVAYAVEHTEVELLRWNVEAEEVETVTGSESFEPREIIGVRVDHRLNLSVPYVRAIFADDYHRTKHGESAYAETAATSLRPLEGIVPELPVEPTLPRRDRQERLQS